MLEMYNGLSVIFTEEYSPNFYRIGVMSKETPLKIGKNLCEILDKIKDGCVVSEPYSLSGDSLFLMMNYYIRKFREDYIVRKSEDYIPINMLGEKTDLSKKLKKYNYLQYESYSYIKKKQKFFTKSKENAQEICNYINKKFNDSTVKAIIYQNEFGLRGIKVPCVEFVKRKNTGVILRNQLKKCEDFKEVKNDLEEMIHQVFSFRDGNFTGGELLKRMNQYRDGIIDCGLPVESLTDKKFMNLLKS